MKTILGISLATAFCLVACPSMAAVVADPAVFQGSGALDPPGAQAITDTETGGGATEAGLEARNDFLAIHDWTGFVPWGQVDGATNLFSFSTPWMPDIEFEYNNISGDSMPGDYGGAITSAKHATSPGSIFVL